MTTIIGFQQGESLHPALAEPAQDIAGACVYRFDMSVPPGISRQEMRRGVAPCRLTLIRPMVALEPPTTSGSSDEHRHGRHAQGPRNRSEPGIADGVVGEIAIAIGIEERFGRAGVR